MYLLVLTIFISMAEKSVWFYLCMIKLFDMLYFILFTIRFSSLESKTRKAEIALVESYEENKVSKNYCIILPSIA